MAPYVDRKDPMTRGGLAKVATSQPLAMTCGLRELLLNGHSQEPAVAMFPQLFSCLAVRLGASVGVQPPRENNNHHSHKNAASQFHVAGTAVEALRILLARAQLDEVLLNHHVVTELLLMDVLMNNMMERISDPCCTVLLHLDKKNVHLLVVYIFMKIKPFLESVSSPSPITSPPL
ncbi:hypothetical protein CRUP_032315 [Coryphaenoides rupestris]|nr:hypothetical protein CRUP_032315 [Coryphaenoides rupestris]